MLFTHYILTTHIHTHIPQHYSILMLCQHQLLKVYASWHDEQSDKPPKIKETKGKRRLNT